MYTVLGSKTYEKILTNGAIRHVYILHWCNNIPASTNMPIIPWKNCLQKNMMAKIFPPLIFYGQDRYLMLTSYCGSLRNYLFHRQCEVSEGSWVQ